MDLNSSSSDLNPSNLRRDGASKPTLRRNSSPSARRARSSRLLRARVLIEGDQGFARSRSLEAFEKLCEACWPWAQSHIEVLQRRRTFVADPKFWERIARSSLQITLAFVAREPSPQHESPYLEALEHPTTVFVGRVIREAMLYIARQETKEWRSAHELQPIDRALDGVLGDLWRSIDQQARPADSDELLIPDPLALLTLRIRQASSPIIGRISPARQQTLLALSGLHRLGIYTCKPMI